MRRKTTTDKSKSDMRIYFKRLEEKGVRPENVAADLRVSFSTVAGWKYGRCKPDYLSVQFLEQRYGVKVG